MVTCEAPNNRDYRDLCMHAAAIAKAPLRLQLESAHVGFHRNHPTTAAFRDPTFASLSRVKTSKVFIGHPLHRLTVSSQLRLQAIWVWSPASVQ